MSYVIEYDKQPIDFLRKLDKQQARRIKEKIEETLPDNPVPQNTVSIVGEQGVFRLRVGDWRVLYRLNYAEKKIIIVKIDKRESVYD